MLGDRTSRDLVPAFRAARRRHSGFDHDSYLIIDRRHPLVHDLTSLQRHTAGRAA